MSDQDRRYAAIMFTDIVGYTALMGSDEDKAFEILKKNQEIHNKLINQFSGTLIKEMGDGMLISFNLASDAVRCAIEIQKTCKEEDIPLKIGIHEGEMVFADADVLGDAVNIASRLQEDAVKGTIYVSSSVHKNVKNKAGISTIFVEERTFKNVDEPVKVYEVLREGEEAQTVKKSSKKGNKQYLYYLFGVAIIVLAAFLIRNYQQENSKPASTVIEKSIAVLPFKSLSEDPEKQYLADGVMNAILLHLSKIEDLRVIMRTSVEKYRNPTQTIPEIAGELQVNHILEGSFQKYGDQARLIVQLSNTEEKEDHIRAEEYNRDWSDIFTVQTEIAQAIANELQAVITPEEKARIASIPTDNAEAYDLYLQATWETNEDVEKGIELLEKAIQLDPEFADAYARLGFLKSQFWWFAESELTSAEEAYNTGMPYYEKALELDPDNVEALGNSMISLTLYRWDFDEAEKKRQILYKEAPDAEQWGDLIPLGRFKEALENTEARFKIDPYSTGTWEGLIMSYYFNNQKDDAQQAIETALKRNFESPHLDMDITRVYLYLEMYIEATAYLDQFFQRYNDFWDRDTPRPLGFLAVAYYHTGRFEETGGILERLKTRSAESSVGSPSFYLSMTYAQMGEIDQAFEWLQKAYEDHEVEMYWLKVEPLFEPMRKDPRWQEMLDKVGFPD